MVISEPAPNATLTEILSARARRTPRDRLGLDIAGGVLVALVALWARPTGWVAIAAAATCFASYGLWAIGENWLRSHPVTEPVTPEQFDQPEDPAAVRWEIVQGAASVLGIGSFVLLLFSVMGLALGTIIS